MIETRRETLGGRGPSAAGPDSVPTASLAGPKRAWGYLRVSTDRQEASLDEQRSAIIRWAREHGYEVVAWFVDEDISGMEFESRPDFQRMIRECDRDRSVEAVLVWSLSRFARPEDAMQSASYMWRIRSTGKVICIVSSNQTLNGDFASFLVAMVQTEQDGRFVKDLSQNITRHQIQNAVQGFSTGRKPAFGVDLLVGPPGGAPRYRVRFVPVGRKRQWRRDLLDAATLVLVRSYGPDESYERSRTDRTTFVAGDPAHVGVVRRIFELSAEGVGLLTIARRLNAEAAPSPCGLGWRTETVRDILRNWIFRGVLVTGRFAEGRVNCQRGDRIEVRSDVRKGKRGRPVPVPKPEAEWNRKDGALEALIPADLWERAHSQLRAKGFPRGGGRGFEGGRIGGRAADSPYLLTPTCGNCGARMHGWRNTREKGGTRYVYATYLCSAYQSDDPAKKCDHNQVDSSALEEYILACMREDFAVGKPRADLEAAIARRLAARRAPAPRPADLAPLAARADALRASIRTGEQQMMREQDEFIREEMRAEVGRLRGELTALEREGERIHEAGRRAEEEESVEAEVRDVLGYLDEAAGALGEGAPLGIRKRAMREYVVRLELFFEVEQKGKRRYSKLARGVLETQDVLAAALGAGSKCDPDAQVAGAAATAELSGKSGRGERIWSDQSMATSIHNTFHTLCLRQVKTPR